MITDQDFQELRWRLVKLEGKVDLLYRNFGLTFVPESGPDDDPRLVEQIQKGKMVEAIKIHRELFGTSLADAKQAVEEMKGRLGL